MGCGSSKGVRASDAPTEQVVIDDEGFPLENGKSSDNATRVSTESLADKPTTSRSSKVQVAPAIELEVVDRATKDRDVHSASSQDSGIDDNDNIITESTHNGEALAASDMPQSIGTDFLVTGSAFGSRNKLRDIDSAKSNQSAKSSFSTQSTASAPSILERPKSRGGCAFDITYEDSRAVRPARLQSLEKKRSGSDLTLEQLEKKLRAAERRRIEYETRIKAKMLRETNKLKKASTSLTREKTTLGNKIDSKEDTATANRRKHLENLRAKLKAKEAKAERVRANRELRKLEQEEALKTNRPTTAQAIAAH